MDGSRQSYPAIVDTGTSQMTIPPKVFEGLHNQWLEQVSDLDCKSDDNFCITNKKCSEISPKLGKVGLQMSGTIFELSPAQYLY